MKILCFGDSNTYGYDPCSFFGGRYDPSDRWVDILAEKSGWEMINAGENGREIPRREGELRRFRELMEEVKPDRLFVMLGGNDLLQGASPEEATARMEAFLLGAQIERENILLIGPLPVARGAWVATEERVLESVELADRCRDMAAKQGFMYVDGRHWGVELTYDGVHFSEKGHRAFAEGLWNYFKDR